MSIAKFFRQGKGDRACGMYCIPDYYGLAGMAKLAYTLGWMRGAI